MGWNDKHIVCVDLAKLAENCGLNAVAMHAPSAAAYCD